MISLKDCMINSSSWGFRRIQRIGHLKPLFRKLGVNREEHRQVEQLPPVCTVDKTGETLSSQSFPMWQECERTRLAGPHSISAECRALMVRRVVGRRSRRTCPGAVTFATVSSSQFEDSPGSRVLDKQGYIGSHHSKKESRGRRGRGVHWVWGDHW